jgi:hypothetical protein
VGWISGHCKGQMACRHCFSPVGRVLVGLLLMEVNLLCFISSYSSGIPFALFGLKYDVFIGKLGDYRKEIWGYIWANDVHRGNRVKRKVLESFFV